MCSARVILTDVERSVRDWDPGAVEGLAADRYRCDVHGPQVVCGALSGRSGGRPLAPGYGGAGRAVTWPRADRWSFE